MQTPIARAALCFYTVFQKTFDHVFDGKSQTDRAMLRVIEYFVKSLSVTRNGTLV